VFENAYMKKYGGGEGRDLGFHSGDYGD
jgi:hypothetical protein